MIFDFSFVLAVLVNDDFLVRRLLLPDNLYFSKLYLCNLVFYWKFASIFDYRHVSELRYLKNVISILAGIANDTHVGDDGPPRTRVRNETCATTDKYITCKSPC